MLIVQLEGQEIGNTLRRLWIEVHLSIIPWQIVNRLSYAFLCFLGIGKPFFTALGWPFTIGQPRVIGVNLCMIHRPAQKESKGFRTHKHTRISMSIYRCIYAYQRRSTPINSLCFSPSLSWWSLKWFMELQYDLKNHAYETQTLSGGN